MRLRPFLCTDYPAVRSLWDACLGATYPVTDRVLMPRLSARTDFEPGDVIVAVERGAIVGLAVTEFDTAFPASQPAGSLNAVLVDPAFRRRGIGRQLVEAAFRRLSERGAMAVTLSYGAWRFWSGVPDNCADAAEFFARCGFVDGNEVIDLCADLSAFAPKEEYARGLAEAGARVEPATIADVPDVCRFMAAESPGWLRTAIARLDAGDWGHMLLVRRDTEICGCIQTYPPESRYRGANLAWEGIYGANLGGFGAVLIAASCRGRGFGEGMCQAAAEYLVAHGASHCYIDWTSHALVKLYSKVGASICRTFVQFRKAL